MKVHPKHAVAAFAFTAALLGGGAAAWAQSTTPTTPTPAESGATGSTGATTPDPTTERVPGRSGYRSENCPDKGDSVGDSTGGSTTTPSASGSTNSDA